MAMLARDRWERLQPFLDCALELSGEQRVAWLDSLRSTDPDVVDELDSLLSEEAAADRRGFLSDPLELVDPSLLRERQGSRGSAGGTPENTEWAKGAPSEQSGIEAR
jgi:hypothetical protein